MSGWRGMESILFEELFKKIRINFLFNHPFLSVLALSIETIYQDNQNSAFESNGFKIFIDEKKLNGYSFEEITYMYAHILLHIVLKHPYRMKTKDKTTWNISANLVVNLILNSFENIGKKPKHEILDFEFSNKCVEEVYEILYKKNQNSVEFSENESFDLIESDSENSVESSEKLNNIIIQALTIAKKSTNLYEFLRVEVDSFIKPSIPMQDLLKEYLVTSLFEKVTTFERPNRRYIHSNLYLAGQKKANEMIEIFIALDSSSSVSLDEYKQFLGFISEICDGFYEYKIVVIPFSSIVNREFIISFDSFNPISESELKIPKSEGGTNFDSVIEYLNHTSINYNSILLVLSDGEFEINQSLVCETLFVISSTKNLKKFEKYGRVIQFNI